MFLLIVLFLQWRPQGMIVQQRRGLDDERRSRSSLPSRTPKPSGFVVRFALMAVDAAAASRRRCCRTSASRCWRSSCASRSSPSASAWRGARAACSCSARALFFGLGGYCMGMHMKIVDAGPGQPARHPHLQRQVRDAAGAVEAVQLGVVRGARWRSCCRWRSRRCSARRSSASASAARTSRSSARRSRARS